MKKKKDEWIVFVKLEPRYRDAYNRFVKKVKYPPTKATMVRDALKLYFGQHGIEVAAVGHRAPEPSPVPSEVHVE